MVQLIRPVDKNIEKLFVPDIETLCHITDILITRIQLASANLQHFFVKALSWCWEIEFFPWSCVNFLHNLIDLLLTDVRKASILGNVLPDESIYIHFVTCEFGSVIRSDGLYAAFEWHKQMYHRPGEFLRIFSFIQFSH